MAEALDRCLACAVYAHPLPRIIKAYKDAGEQRLAPYLAELLYDTALHAQVVAPDRLRRCAVRCGCGGVCACDGGSVSAAWF